MWHFSFSSAHKYLSPERRGESIWGSELLNARRAPIREEEEWKQITRTKVQPRVTSDEYRVSVDIIHNTSTQNDKTFVSFLGCILTSSKMFPMFLLESRRQISFFFFFFNQRGVLIVFCLKLQLTEMFCWFWQCVHPQTHKIYCQK